ncbi:MAG TPA: type II secretion system F family protein [Elusimicrobiota bacterium]|nr:type II secretion system F family protein [Elusimicrobiota bacterium]
MILTAAFLLVVVLFGAHQRNRRQEAARNRLAGQLRESLQNIVHSLRAGAGFMHALDYAAREAEEPLAAEWRRLLQAASVGQSLSEAVEQLAARIPIKEMRWFVSAVQITQTTGGSLADVLDILAASLQEQQTLREKVAALTAQGRASGMVLSGLPFLMVGAMFWVTPDMIRAMFASTLGQWMLSGSLFSITVGFVVIQSIVSVKVD